MPFDSQAPSAGGQRLISKSVISFGELFVESIMLVYPIDLAICIPPIALLKFMVQNLRLKNLNSEV